MMRCIYTMEYYSGGSDTDDAVHVYYGILQRRIRYR